MKKIIVIIASIGILAALAAIVIQQQVTGKRERRESAKNMLYSRAEIISKSLARSSIDLLGDEDDVGLADVVAKAKVDYPDIQYCRIIDNDNKIWASAKEDEVGAEYNAPKGLTSLGKSQFSAQEYAGADKKALVHAIAAITVGGQKIGEVHLALPMAAAKGEKPAGLPVLWLLIAGVSVIGLAVLGFTGCDQDLEKIQNDIKQKRKIETQLNETVKSLRKEEEYFRKKTTDLKEEEKKKAEALIEVKRQIAGLTREIEQNQAVNIEAKALLEKYKTEIGQLKYAVQSHQAQAGQLDEKIKKQEESERLFRERPKGIAKGEETVEVWLNRAKEQTLALEQGIAEKQGELERLKSVCLSQEQQIKAYRSQLEELSAAKSALENEIRDCSQKHKYLVEQIEHLTPIARVLKTKISKKTT